MSARENGLRLCELRKRSDPYTAPRRLQSTEEHTFLRTSGPHLALYPEDRPGTVLLSAIQDWGGGYGTECGGWSFPSYFTALSAALAAWQDEAIGRLFLHCQPDASTDCCKTLPHPVTIDNTRRFHLHMDETSALVIWPLLPHEWEITRVEEPGRWAGGRTYRLVHSTSNDERSVRLRPIWALWDTYGEECSRFSTPSGSTFDDITAIIGPGADLDLAISDTALKWHAEGRIVGKTYLDTGHAPVSAFESFGTREDRHDLEARVGVNFGNRTVRRSPVFGSSRQQSGSAISDSLKSVCTWPELNSWLRTLNPEAKVGIILACDRPPGADERAEVLRLGAAYPSRLRILVACRQEGATGVQPMRW